MHHFALPRRLRRRGDQPLSRLRDAGRRCTSDLPGELSADKAVKRYIKAIGKGLLKVMSKMGISTYQSLLRRADLRGHRPERATSSTSTSPAPPAAIEGIGLIEIAEEAVRMHRAAFGDEPV